jgi:hypothetical protein
MYVVIEEKELVSVIEKLIKVQFGLDPEQLSISFRASTETDKEEAIVTFIK